MSGRGTARLANALALAIGRYTKSHFIALGGEDEVLYRLVFSSLLQQPILPIEGVHKARMERVVLLRWRSPEEEWVYVEWDILFKEWDREIEFSLCGRDAVEVSQVRAHEGHARKLGTLK